MMRPIHDQYYWGNIIEVNIAEDSVKYTQFNYIAQYWILHNNIDCVLEFEKNPGVNIKIGIA
jgi:hypothetical protein